MKTEKTVPLIISVIFICARNSSFLFGLLVFATCADLLSFAVKGEVIIVEAKRKISNAKGDVAVAVYDELFDTRLEEDCIFGGKALAHAFGSQKSGPFIGNQWTGDGIADMTLLPDGLTGSGCWVKSELNLIFEVTEAVKFTCTAAVTNARNTAWVDIRGIHNVVGTTNETFSGTFVPGKYYYLDARCYATASTSDARRHSTFHFDLVFDFPTLRLTCPQPVQINCAPPEGQTVTLTSGVRDEQGNSLTVVWTVDGAPVATNQIPSTAPTPNAADVTLTRLFSTGTHMVGVSVTNGVSPAMNCSTTVSVQTGAAPPTVLLADVAACTGSAVVLRPIVHGAAPFSYQWMRDGTRLPGATNATSGPITTPGGYSVSVCDVCGCATSRVATVSFSDGPQILEDLPESLTAGVGSPLSLSVLATDDVPLTYQWLFNGQMIIGAISPAIDYASIQAGHAGVYQVVVSGGNCTVISAPCVLTVIGNPLDAEFTEGNAAQWCPFASDGAAVSLTDDTTHVRSGRYSLGFSTGSGFDTGVRFPCSPTAHWDVNAYDYLEFWGYAENPWPNGFQGNQPVVVLKTANGVFRYEPPGQMTTNHSWSRFRIPLAGDAFWRRTATNHPTLADVNQIEIHQDTWDYGFTIYYDGVKFVRSSECPRLVLDQPQPLGNGFYRISLSRAESVLFYSNSPPVVDLRYCSDVAAPWSAWLRAPAEAQRVQSGKLVWDHASSAANQFYRAEDRSVLRFNVPATATFGGLGTLPGKFVYPQGMCLGVGGELHVVDNSGERVQVFDKDTLAFKREYANGLFFPKDVAVDGNGLCYVTAYGAESMWVYAPDGSLLRSFPLRSEAFPEGLCIDPTSGNLVVAEAPTGESRISVWTSEGTLVRSWVPPTGASDVWVSGRGEVFCAAWGAIYHFSSTGALLGQFTPRHLANAICGDDTGILYVTYLDHASVDAYSIDGEFQSMYEMTPCSLEPPYSGFTFGVAYSGPNQLFVTDRATHKVARLEIIRLRCSDCNP